MRHLGPTLIGVVAALAVGAVVLVACSGGGGVPSTTPYGDRGSALAGPSASTTPEPRLDPGPAPAAQGRQRPAARRSTPGKVAHVQGPVDTGLTRPVHGTAAVAALGEALPEVAANAGLEPAQLDGVLSSDPTAWVSPDGMVFYKEQIPTAPTPVAGLSKDAGAQQAPYPLDRTFALHSLPGSHHTLYLDFDGVSISSTNGWALQSKVPTGTYAGWDPAGNGAAFTDDERAAVQGIWARVAEDYSAFDVDVTTQDPGTAALAMSDPSDVDFGTHVVMTDSAAPQTAICGAGGCGGVAWTGVINAPLTSWGRTTAPDRNEVAWVFPNSLDDMSSSIAEAASHEAGHTFGLVHDGTSTTGDSYFTPNNGNGSKVWAPIMGAAYYNAVSQWSKGDYPSATNWGNDSRGNPVRIAAQDDVALIRAIAGTRPQQASSLASPLAADGTTRYRTRSDDSDVYLLGSCAAGATVTAAGSLVGPDADLVLSVVDDSGRPAPGTTETNPTTTQTGVADPDPWNRAYRVESPAGLGASITLPSAGGPWFAVVRSGGNLGGAWASGGYDAYGSLGAYVLSQTGCTLAGGAASDAGPPRTTTSAPPTATSPATSDAATPSTPSTPPPSVAPSPPPPAAPMAPRAPAAPQAVIRPGQAGGARTVVVSWVPGASGTRPVATFQVTLYVVQRGRTRVLRQLVVGPTLRQRELRLPAGGRKYAATVLARSPDGSSVPSRRTRAVAAR